MNIKILLGLSICYFSIPVFAATPIDFPEHSLSELNVNTLANIPQQEFKKVDQAVDFNQTTHVRLQQIYHGYPVWGGGISMHLLKGIVDKNAFATGRIYKDLSSDLKNPPNYLYSKTQADNALQNVIALYKNQSLAHVNIVSTHIHSIVYLDDQSKAHWAFLIKFNVDSNKPQKPSYIVDALNFTVYREWDDIQTWQPMLAGGYGGNQKTGKSIYNNLNIERDMVHKLCYLKNTIIAVKDAHKQNQLVKFKCETPLNEQNIYWDGDIDAINGGFSPANDALYAGQVVQTLYQSWYHIPVLSYQGRAMHLNVSIHKNMENAYWDGEEVVFGDGGNSFYPLVSLSIAAHEFSHGFTQQQSRLVNYGESAGLNESFSDMAAAAVEYYLTGHNTWQIGTEVLKEPNKALRYLDKPAKDCIDLPGQQCSIENIKDYYPGLDAHFSSGIFNKVFYLISTAPRWDTHKAFNIMVQANRYYWTAFSTFNAAACGVMKAVRDYAYDTKAVTRAFESVGIKVPTSC